MAKKVPRGQKLCPQCGKWVKGTRAKSCPKCQYDFGAKQQNVAAAQTATASAEKAAKPGDTITLEQVKSVAQAVKTIGGYDRFRELLEVIRQVGGLRRFKDLLEAMSTTEAGEVIF
jgi:hypothetical protein